MRYYNVIYDIIEDVKKALTGMLGSDVRENILGIAEVRDVFRSPKFGAVAGCMVIEGLVHRNRPIRVLRDDVVIFEGELDPCVASRTTSPKFVPAWNAVSR